MRILAAALLVVAAACSSGQDPGISPEPGSGPSTTSRTLGACPADAPGVTIPPAGCLEDDGTVRYP